MLLDTFVISLDYNKIKVDLCPDLLDSTWVPVQPAHNTLIKSLRPSWSRAIFWRLNVRILDWERLLLYHQELDNYLYLTILIFFTRRPVLVYGEIS